VAASSAKGHARSTLWSELRSFLTLHRTREMLRGRLGRGVAVGIGLLYGLLALLAGSMLQFGPTGASRTTVQVLSNPYSPAWWNYPALLVTAPGGILVLPFFATLSMLVVSVGVGVGMGAGLLLAVRFVRSWRLARSRSGFSSSLVGLTPAMVALLTLGACCSTSAAAAGSIGAIAVASGTTYNQIILNSWILNVFQVAVLAAALLAQEKLIGIFGEWVPSLSKNPVPAADSPSDSRVPAVLPTEESA
jgi:hypothetical protein